MKNQLLILIIILSLYNKVSAQHSGLTFQEANTQGISIPKLDSIYKNAIHTDTSLEVLKQKRNNKRWVRNI